LIKVKGKRNHAEAVVGTTVEDTVRRFILRAGHEEKPEISWKGGVVSRINSFNAFDSHRVSQIRNMEATVDGFSLVFVLFLY
jgi:hypothetical protein